MYNNPLVEQDGINKIISNHGGAWAQVAGGSLLMRIDWSYEVLYKNLAILASYNHLEY